MTNSAQLEREAELTRSRLALNLEELRGRISPGRIVDQAIDYARGSMGADFARNLGRQVADHPLPVGLIGIGVAWLMLGGGRPFGQSRFADAAPDRDAIARTGTNDGASAARRKIGDWASQTSDAAQHLRDMASSTTSGAADTMANAKSRLADSASALGERTSSLYEDAKSRASAATDAMSDAYGRLADTAGRATSRVTQSASGLGQQAIGGTRGLLQFCAEQPLVLAGIGVALGAVIGAVMPSTEAERRAMGETSERFKDRAREMIAEPVAKAKAAAASGLQQAGDEAQRLTDPEAAVPSDGSTRENADAAGQATPARAGAAEPSGHEPAGDEPWGGSTAGQIRTAPQSGFASTDGPAAPCGVEPTVVADKKLDASRDDTRSSHIAD